MLTVTFPLSVSFRKSIHRVLLIKSYPKGLDFQPFFAYFFMASGGRVRFYSILEKKKDGIID